jgi:prenyltransferase beta subunit
MSYTCHYCNQDTEAPHSITIYQENGLEQRLEVLCDSCYSDWLLSLKG